MDNRKILSILKLCKILFAKITKTIGRNNLIIKNNRKIKFKKNEINSKSTIKIVKNDECDISENKFK
ncbi:hypothetical protein LI221_08590 [Faecalimonas umbilicata]|nr:hypothetical protein [Faecalimonas umbilicata]